MPKKYDPKQVEEWKRGYSEEILGQAICAVKRSGMAIRQASKTYKIPFSTLHRHVTSECDHFQKPGPKPVLSEEIEARLVEAILAFQSFGYGLGRLEIINLAKQIDDKQGNVAFNNRYPSDMWFKRFSERHDFILRTPRALAKNRDDTYVNRRGKR